MLRCDSPWARVLESTSPRQNVPATFCAISRLLRKYNGQFRSDDDLINKICGTAIAKIIKSAANGLLWDVGAGLYCDNQTTTLHLQDGNSWAMKANATRSDDQSRTISEALRARWRTYGGPAPEAGATISPFISGFEFQSHYMASQPAAALDLMRLQWGFLPQDPRMTQSTFIEGYATDGSLHNAPYTNDPHISHAPEWSTGPTSALSAFAAGIQLSDAAVAS
ncbi:rhamnosidase B precursor [Penicillium sp. IBT 18751x]|nr:rhamnosidase B precursor [Penicillium sp. IBT 18751x]